MGWHADDEKEIRQDKPIVGIGLGATMRVIARDKRSRKVVAEIMSSHGSCYVMDAGMQQTHEHRVAAPRKRDNYEPGMRWSLTFRCTTN